MDLPLKTLFLVLASSCILRSTNMYEWFPPPCSRYPDGCYWLGGMYCSNVTSWGHLIHDIKTYCQDDLFLRLRITDFNITGISERDFQGIKLREFALFDGIIGVVNDEAFSSVPTLSDLVWINVRSLSTIPRSLSMTNLQRLILSRVGLMGFGYHLQNMTMLEDLDLSSNSISFVHPDAFRNCFKLRKLDLSFNRIQHLDRNVLSAVHSLNHLDLRYNEISSLAGVIAPSAQAILELRLSGNMLTNVSDVITVPFPELELLELADNPLQVLRIDNFKDKIQSLRTLSLSNTSLNKIDAHCFDNFTDLENLKLDKNNLIELSEDLFPYTLISMEIDLSKNKLRTVLKLFSRETYIWGLNLESNM